MFFSAKNSSKMDAKHRKQLAARYSRGNVNSQRGHFITAEEKQLRKEKVLNAKFV